MFKRLVMVATVFLLAASPAFGQRRDPLEYIRIMESADRVRMLQVDRVIRTLNLEKGQVVADLGAGSGLFSRPMARAVGSEGLVYAIDIDPSMLEHVDETAGEQDLSNIRTVLAGEFDPRIPQKVDLIFICDTLHQIENPGEYLRLLARYMKPSARVAIIDYEKWPKHLERAKFTVRDLTAWMKAAGFQKAETHKFLEGNFFVTFRYQPKTP